MARKLFISFLGTNFYHECYYTDGGGKATRPVMYNKPLSKGL